MLTDQDIQKLSEVFDVKLEGYQTTLLNAVDLRFIKVDQSITDLKHEVAELREDVRKLTTAV